MKLEKYFEKYRLQKGIESDKALAERLGRSPQFVSRMQKTGSVPDDICEMMAESLDIPTIEILIAREARKEEFTGKKGPWTKGLQILEKATAALLLIGFFSINTVQIEPTTHDLNNKDYRK